MYAGFVGQTASVHGGADTIYSCGWRSGGAHIRRTRECVPLLDPVVEHDRHPLQKSIQQPLQQQLTEAGQELAARAVGGVKAAGPGNELVRGGCAGGAGVSTAPRNASKGTVCRLVDVVQQLFSYVLSQVSTTVMWDALTLILRSLRVCYYCTYLESFPLAVGCLNVLIVMSPSFLVLLE